MPAAGDTYAEPRRAPAAGPSPAEPPPTEPAETALPAYDAYAEPDAALRALRPSPPEPPAPSEPPAGEPVASAPSLGPAARVIAVALLIGAGALAGLLLTRGGAEAPQDALAVVRSASRELVVEFETAEPDQASRFVADAYGRRVVPPELRGYALAGVAPAALDADATTPAFVYDGPDGRVGVVALDYALLDAAGDRLAFGPDLRGLLTDDTRAYLRESGPDAAVLWRDRDDVFVAFPADAQAVADAVVLPQR